MKRKLLNFKDFLFENTTYSSVNEENQIDSISSSELEKIIDVELKSYLKRAMWNKSIQVFYGKDYKGNPTDRKRVV
jgi:hypothetical protein